MSFIVKSTYTVFLFRFRVICRTLSCFVLAQIPKGISFAIRLSADSPHHIRYRTNITTDTMQAYHQLDILNTNKTYVEVQQVIQYSLTFIHDLKHSFANVVNLLTELCRLLCRSETYLQIIFDKD